MPQCGPLDVLVLIAPLGVILFLDAVSEWIPSGCGQEQRGFPFVLLLTVGFPLVFDMGGGFKECKNNLFSVREIIDQEIPFQQIQPSIYGVYIYLAFKYGNIKFYLYLEGSGASRVAVGCRCAVGGQPLKDLSKVIHHWVPLFLEGLLDQYFERISCSLFFLFFHVPNAIKV